MNNRFSKQSLKEPYSGPAYDLGSSHPSMKEIGYNLIITLPPFVLPLILLLCEFILWRWRPTWLEELKEFVVINAFSGIVKEKSTVKIDTSEAANNCEGIKLYEETRWLLKGIDITDRKDEIFKLLHWLFLAILFSCALIFWNFLLLEVSFSCDDDDNTKDCFEYDFWNSDAFTLGRDPIDCSSAGVQNGTVEVVCYKIVVNYGLAAGASYGAFKFTMVVLNVVASVFTINFTKVSTTWIVCLAVRTISVLVFFGVQATIIAIQATSSRIFFRGSNLVTLFKIVATTASTAIFVVLIPWKDLVTKKHDSADSSLQNPADGKRQGYNTFHSESSV